MIERLTTAANVELSPIDGAAIARLIARSAATPREVIESSVKYHPSA